MKSPVYSTNKRNYIHIVYRFVCAYVFKRDYIVPLFFLHKEAIFNMSILTLYPFKQPPHNKSYPLFITIYKIINHGNRIKRPV
jgi:hypothetical protein